MTVECGVCNASFTPETVGQDVCAECSARVVSYHAWTERELLYALEMAALAEAKHVREGERALAISQRRLGNEIHEALAARYGWRS